MSTGTSFLRQARLLLTFLATIIAGGLLVVGIVEVLRVSVLKYLDVVIPGQLGLLLYLVGMSAVGAFSIGRYRKRVASTGGFRAIALQRWLGTLGVSLFAGGAERRSAERKSSDGALERSSALVLPPGSLCGLLGIENRSRHLVGNGAIH